MIWYEKTKKYTKEELKKEGKSMTQLVMLVAFMTGFFCMVSSLLSSFFPLFIFYSIELILFWSSLNRLKSEWYERFCK